VPVKSCHSYIKLLRWHSTELFRQTFSVINFESRYFNINNNDILSNCQLYHKCIYSVIIHSYASITVFTSILQSLLCDHTWCTIQPVELHLLQMLCSRKLISAPVFAVLLSRAWRWCVWTYSQMLCDPSAMLRSVVNDRFWFGRAQKWSSSSSLLWWNMVSIVAW